VTDDELTTTAFHEAGHAVAAHLLGRRVEICSVRRGEHFQGATSLVDPSSELLGPSSDAPAIFLPGSMRRLYECQIVILYAGRLAETLCTAGPRTGFSGGDSDEQQAEAVASRTIFPPSDEERAGLMLLEQMKIPSDEDAAGKLVEELVPGERDPWPRIWAISASAERAAYLDWLRSFTTRFIHRDPFPRMVGSLVPVLVEEKVVSGRAVHEILRVHDPEGAPTRDLLGAAARLRHE